MSIISMKALLESGVHFGHRTHKWHPLMKPYIFTERNGIHIIDLQKTVKAIEHAYGMIREIVADGGFILFVGTKRQAQEMIQSEATRCGMPYVTERWLGGMLTNWRTIRQRINELERLERMRDSGEMSHLTKKEGLIMSRQIERLEGLLGGIRQMTRVPDALFVVDVQREETAIHEANLLKIPVIGMVDTNCDPRKVDYVIPSNDDAIRAIKLMVSKIADAVLEGKALRKEEEVEEPFYARAAVEEPELSDEELLGEATLAKLGTKASVFDELETEEIEELVEVEDEIEIDPEYQDEEEEEEDEGLIDEVLAEEAEFEEVEAVSEEPDAEVTEQPAEEVEEAEAEEVVEAEVEEPEK
jgi:small subunit ribosomal protein S2